MTGQHPIYDALDALIAAAKRGAPGGKLFPTDMAGLYRRTAKECNCTPEDVEALHKLREGASHV